MSSIFCPVLIIEGRVSTVHYQYELADGEEILSVRWKALYLTLIREVRQKEKGNET